MLLSFYGVEITIYNTDRLQCRIQKTRNKDCKMSRLKYKFEKMYLSKKCVAD